MTRIFAGVVAAALSATLASAQPIGSAFTYQGRLRDNGAPASGAFDFRFILYDAPVGGSQVGPIEERADVVVADGLFTLPLDFGPAAFAGGARWLDVSVRAGASTGAYAALGARQELTPAPAATFSARAPWSGISGKPPGFEDDDDADTLAGLTCASGQVPKWGGASWFCSADEGTTYGAGAGLQLVSNVFSLSVGGVASVNLADAAVVESKLASASVTGAKLANGAVDSAKLADLAVTTNKIGVGAVTTAQIAQGTIAFADLGQNGCALNEVIKHNGAVWGCGTDQDTTYTAGAGLSLAGTVFGIADDGVTTPRLANAAVTTAKLADLSVTANKIGVGAVLSAQIADGTIALQDIGANGCLANQVLKWNGSAWSCAADTDSGGDITSVTAGPGLTGGASTGAATLAVGFAGSGAAATVSRSDHDHLGQGWSTSASPGLQVTSSGATGLAGRTDSAANGSRGVLGVASATTGENYGVHGRASSTVGAGVLGESTGTAGTGVLGIGRFGVGGESSSPTGSGVYGASLSSTGTAMGVQAISTAPGGFGVYAAATAITGDAIGIFARTSAPDGYAGWFQGDVEVVGILTRPAEALKIDHPLDPENRYLQLSGVASPDMKNVLDGVVVTDASGYGVVELPAWFEAAHRDFRYQLTVLDEGDHPGFVQAKVVRKIAGGRFTVRASAPHAELSWQVTGIRADRFAERHRTVVEAAKRPAERGTYLHPDVWDQPTSRGLAARREKGREEER